MLKSLWLNLQGEPNIFIKAKCVKCTEELSPERLHVLVLKGSPNPNRARQTGRIRICGVSCIDSVNGQKVIFNKSLRELTAGDIQWMLADALVNYTLFEENLLVDFCIAVHQYRQDARFQSF